MTRPVPPSIVIVVALGELQVAERDRALGQVDRERLAPGHARLPHPPRDDGRVRGHAAVRREDAARLDQPVDVVRRRLPADEDHVLALAAALLGRVGVEHDRARRGTRRRVQPRCRDVDLRSRVDHRVQQLVELVRVDARHRLLARDQPLVDHLDGDAQGGRGGALAGARLQEEERALLDRELDVLHLPVVRLEPPKRLDEAVERLRHPLAHRLDRLGRADAGDDVLALRVREELAEEPCLAGSGVAREADAGTRAFALVPEDHLDDVDRGAEVVGDLVGPPVDLGARRVPRVEHRADRPPQLLAGRPAGTRPPSPPRRSA